MSVVLDASALLAVFLNEPGGDMVLTTLEDAMISAVNLSEIYATAGEKGLDIVAMRRSILALPIRIIPFDETHAAVAGQLRTQTRGLGLSLGDRACLAVAIVEKRRVLTADRIWQKLNLGVDIVLIR